MSRRVNSIPWYNLTAKNSQKYVKVIQKDIDSVHTKHIKWFQTKLNETLIVYFEYFLELLLH